MIAAALALDALVAGLVMLAVLLAGALIVRPLLVGLASQLPVVGPALASRVDSVLNSWLGAITPGAQGGLATVTGLLNWIEFQARALSGNLTGFARDTYNAIWRVENAVLPHAILQAMGAAQALIDAAEQRVSSFAQGVESRALAGLSALSAQAASWFAAASSYALGLAVQAERDAQYGIAQVESHLQAVAAAERGLLVQGLQAASAEARSLANAEHAFADAAIQAVESDLHRLIAAERVLFQDTTAILGHDLGVAEEQLAAQPAEFQRNLDASIQGILTSAPWHLISEMVANGEQLLATSAGEIAGKTARQLKGEIDAADSLRIRFAPLFELVKAGVIRGLEGK
jgi:hypothetical protein